MPTTAPVPLPHVASAGATRSKVPLDLWNDVVRAHVVLADQRHQRASTLPDARLDLLDALEAYVSSLHQRTLPVPYPIRDELRLLRLTCSSHPRQYVGPPGEGARRGH